jgi:predicted HTH transcriptional regulator
LSTTAVVEVIRHPCEERHIEFKKSTKWEDGRFKAIVTKSILGMANIRDGGWIVIGKEEQSDGAFYAAGMSQSDYESYDPDSVKDFVKEYADPNVNVSVLKTEHEQKNFVLVQIEEFENIPVICKRAYDDVLHRGRIYTRSRGKPETIEVPSQTEMREIIDMAVEKQTRDFVGRLSRLGLLRPGEEIRTPTDEEAFGKQLEGVL